MRQFNIPSMVFSIPWPWRKWALRPLLWRLPSLLLWPPPLWLHLPPLPHLPLLPPPWLAVKRSTRPCPATFWT